ncbi:MAG TPA: hypothetical protein VFI29_23210 [Hanamia sp.]|nr:hypothetical protein [Hanamia sp.]
MKTFYLIAAFAFLPCMLTLSKPGVSDHLETYKNHRYKKDAKGVLLVYAGSFKSPQFSYDIGIRVEIDSSLGVRYNVVFENGDNVMSQTALFYKFSNPNKIIFYNFLTHQSMIHNCCGSAGGGSNVKPVGKDAIGKYNCTHVQGINNNERRAEDYWVSTQVPGYLLLLKILKGIGPGYKQMFVNEYIFQWGGLVKMTSTSHGQMAANINLIEANTTMDFPASDFDVPSN